MGDSKTQAEGYWPHLENDLYAEVDVAAFGGATAASMQAAIDGYLVAISDDKQVALVNLGVNDVSALPAQAAWEADLAYILDAIRTKWADADVLVMRPWRRNFDAECNTVAGWIANVVGARGWASVGPDERVFLENGDNGVTYTVDGVHPTLPGYELTADEWRLLLVGY